MEFGKTTSEGQPIEDYCFFSCILALIPVATETTSCHMALGSRDTMSEAGEDGMTQKREALSSQVGFCLQTDEEAEGEIISRPRVHLCCRSIHLALALYVLQKSTSDTIKGS